MKYISLNGDPQQVDFATAAIIGQAPDKGLYFPTEIPDASYIISNIQNLPNNEIAFRVIKPYVGNCIADEKLFEIVTETVNFPIPLVKVTDTISSLELFHGPTLAFKDVGARFMSRCLAEMSGIQNRPSVVLVATSGDTGGAVADGFYGVKGINVVILYPSGKVSPVQEKQLTALGKNIKALEIKGTFDDCQRLVKSAFADANINERLFLTSANSINIARWLPQQFYYFFAFKQWHDKAVPPVISVPSGNFGNLCAGVVAACSGLPVKHFIAACNSNDVVPDYFSTGMYRPKTAVATFSNAMDVGDPSNFPRLITMLKKYQQLSLSAVSISDDITIKTMKEVYNEYNYILDPHGAVAYRALNDYCHSHPYNKGIFLETAHPVKFPAVVEYALKKTIPIPQSVSSLMQQPKKSLLMEPSFEQLKEYLLYSDF